MYDRSEFIETMGKRKAEENEARVPQLMQIKAAGVSASLLTRMPEWDKFLSYLQAVRDPIQETWESLGEELDNPEIMDPIDVAEKRTKRMMMAANLELLDSIMRLPADLMEGGEQADKIMESFLGADAVA